MKHLSRFTLLMVVFLSLTAYAQESKFDNFITAEGSRLMDGKQEFRFLSFNIPNLNFVEDEMAFTKVHPFGLPTSFEIRDALVSVQQMGGTVARQYTFPVKREFDTLDIPRYVLGPGEFDENSFRVMDTVLAVANDVGVRVIVPLLNNWKWMGGVPQYAGFRGKEKEDFWTDDQLIADFKKTVEFVLNRTNTVTGVKYKDDKAILCWETGNELTCPYSWTEEIVEYIKSIDENHLVMDGYHAIDGKDIPEESIEDDLVDIVTTHHYKLNPEAIVEDIKSQMERVAGRKPYVVGEFGFLGTDAIGRVSDFIIENDIVGGLVWSLRHHREDGGFYWHSEPLGGDLYKAFHHPGFTSGIDYNEELMMELYRRKAFEIRNLEVPPLPVPDAPVLLPVESTGRISWQGSTGARYYDIQRTESVYLPWQTVGYNVSDADQTYTSLFADNSVDIGIAYYYRVIAKNESGSSTPSNVAGPVVAEFKTMIEEFENLTVLYFLEGDAAIADRYDRAFKEDMFRLDAPSGTTVTYYVPGEIKRVTLNTFTEEDKTGLRLLVSADGEDFQPLSAERTSFYLGKGDYDYWIPSQYIAETTAEAGGSYLRLEITDHNQLSRMEIDYVPSE